MSTLPARPSRQPSPEGSSSASRATPADTAALTREVRRIADRFRHLSESRLRGRIDPDDLSGGGLSRAAAGLALARRLAALGDAPDGAEVPDLGAFAVGDQIAVTGLDLVAHLDRAAADAGTAGPGTGPAVLDEALRAVRELAAQI